MAEFTLTSFGAVSDARELNDAAIAASTNVLTSVSAPFASGDVDKPIVVAGAGASGAKLRTTIASFVSPTEVTLASAAAVTVIEAGAVFGTDCSAALQAGLGAIEDALGGTLLVDGRFLLTDTVSTSFGGETASTKTRLVGTGDSAVWIGTASGTDALSITSGGLELRDLRFLGVPGATQDARRVLNLNGVSASIERCAFLGLMAQEAIVYASNSYINTYECMFGGSFVAGTSAGYVNSVVENKNWAEYRDEYSNFIDYGYFDGRTYSKSGIGGNLAWIRADTPIEAVGGARRDGVFSLRGTRLDEGALHGIVAKPTTGTIAHVHFTGLRQNITSADTGRGVHCQNVQWVVMEECWQGLSTTPALVGHFQDCGTVLIDSLKLSDSVNRLSATNVTSLTLKDTTGVTSFTFSNVNFHPVTSRYADVSLIKGGAVADSDFVAPPAQGTLAFDRTNNRLYIKRVTTGGWIYFDMSGGDPFGPELVVNGTFASGSTTGWTPYNSSTLSVVGGALRVTNGALYGQALQSVATVVGQQYQASAQIVGGTASALVRVGKSHGDGSYGQFSGTGGTTTFTATLAIMYFTLILDSESVGKYADFDNISLKAV
jgi:hypothetical protein